MGALRLRFAVQQTTNKAGATAVGQRYTLDGTVADHRTFADTYADGEEADIAIWSGTTQEIIRGRYIAADDEIEVVATRDSTNAGSPVVWPASGTRNIAVVPDGARLEKLFDAPAGGFLAKTALDDYTTRLVAAAPGSLLSITGGDGSADVVVDDAALQLAALFKTAGATVAQRTMSGRLILAAVATIIAGRDGSNRHTFYGDDGLTDVLGDLERLAADSWRMRLSIAGALRRVLTANADDLNDADVLAGYDPTAGANYSLSNPGYVDFGTWFGGLTLNFGRTVAGANPTDVALGRAYSSLHLFAHAQAELGGGTSSDGYSSGRPHPTTPLTHLRINPSNQGVGQFHAWLSIGF